VHRLLRETRSSSVGPLIADVSDDNGLIADEDFTHYVDDRFVQPIRLCPPLHMHLNLEGTDAERTHAIYAQKRFLGTTALLTPTTDPQRAAGSFSFSTASCVPFVCAA
jgi:hypothetical protein